MNHDDGEVAFDPPTRGHRFYRLVETSRFDAGLQIERVGSQLRLRWNSGTLEFAQTVTGPWMPLSGAVLPVHFVVPGPATGFYRVRQ